MSDAVRRHVVYFSDREVMLLDRAVKAYIQIIRIKTDITNVRTEADDSVRVSGIITGHRNCKCPVPVDN